MYTTTKTKGNIEIVSLHKESIAKMRFKVSLSNIFISTLEKIYLKMYIFFRLM